MRDDLALVFALVVFALGAVLLYDGVAGADVGQSAKVIGGAVLISLGSTTFLMVLRTWWRWKRTVNQDRER